MPRRGFSLIELLVVVVILGILFALYMPVLGKARQAAEKTAGGEAVRHEGLSRFAERANEARRKAPRPPTRAECREAFRYAVDTGDGESLVTRPLYVCMDEREFRAYYHTVINPAMSGPLEIRRGLLVARDPEGIEYRLTPVTANVTDLAHFGRFPALWEFLSTNLGDTTLSGRTVGVAWNDGTFERIRYGSGFPASRAVAEAGAAYMRSR